MNKIKNSKKITIEFTGFFVNYICYVTFMINKLLMSALEIC